MSIGELRRVHILPVESPVPEQNRLSTIAPELGKIRDEGSPLSSGQFIVSQGQKFVVFMCDPEEGRLGTETLYFTEGPPVTAFAKIQLNAVRQAHSPPGPDADGLFNEYVKPFFHSLNSTEDRTQLLELGQTITIFDQRFEVAATEPRDRVGFVNANSIVYAEWEEPPPVQMLASDEDMIRQAMAVSRGGYGVPPQGVPWARDSNDHGLAAAIAASFSGGGNAPRAPTEEEMMMRAIRNSQMEEENRQRQTLREQQEAELAESMLMDQMREAEAQQKRQEEERKRQEEAEAEKVRLEEDAKQRARVAAELQTKRSRLTEEPPTGELGRIQLVLRLPSGQRLQRAFRNSEAVGLIYDFLDVQQLAELDGKQYRLISNMPRMVYEDQAVTVDAAGIKNQFVLMVELMG